MADETPATAPPENGSPVERDGDYAPTVVARFTVWQRSGGVVVPLLTAVLAFLIGGLVVLATGQDPLAADRALFEGSRLHRLGPLPGVPHPRDLPAPNTHQTLL